jgi:hypothetical protein
MACIGLRLDFRWYLSDFNYIRRPAFRFCIKHSDRERSSIAGACVEAGGELAQFGFSSGLMAVDDMLAEIMILFLPAPCPEQNFLRLFSKRMMWTEAGVNKDVFLGFYESWKRLQPFDMLAHFVSMAGVGLFGFDSAIAEPQGDIPATLCGDHHLLMIAPQGTPDAGRARVADKIPHKIDYGPRVRAAIHIIAQQNDAIQIHSGVRLYLRHGRAELIMAAMNIANGVNELAHVAMSVRYLLVFVSVPLRDQAVYFLRIPGRGRVVDYHRQIRPSVYRKRGVFEGDRSQNGMPDATTATPFEPGVPGRTGIGALGPLPPA